MARRKKPIDLPPAPEATTWQPGPANPGKQWGSRRIKVHHTTPDGVTWQFILHQAIPNNTWQLVAAQSVPVTVSLAGVYRP